MEIRVATTSLYVTLAVFLSGLFTGVAEKCPDNQFGYTCQQKCGPNCVSGCDRLTGNCDRGCHVGFHSDWCLAACGAGCADGCDQATGVCHTCRQGYHGGNCDRQCSEHCRDGCQRDSGFCFGCKNGRYGSFCEMQCIQTCAGKCDQINGNCDVCSTGHYGKRCTKGLCFSGRDACIGCIAGYFGTYCQESCHKNCHSECNKLDGHCFTCKEGYYGDTCDDKCPDNCIGHCKVGGACYGCTTGWYGRECDKECPEKCKGACGQVSGRCLESAPPPKEDKGAEDREEAKRLSSAIEFPVIPVLIAGGSVTVVLFAIAVYSIIYRLCCWKSNRSEAERHPAGSESAHLEPHDDHNDGDQA